MIKKRYTYEETHRTVKGVRQKLCNKCLKWKAQVDFYKNSIRRDGLSSRCKDCDNAKSRKRYRKKRKSRKKYYRYEECHRVVKGVKQKRCRKCRIWKTYSEFYNNILFKDGIQYVCKQCSDKATNKSRRKRQMAARKQGTMAKKRKKSAKKMDEAGIMTAAIKLSKTTEIKGWLRTADKPLAKKEADIKKSRTKRRTKRRGK